MELAADVRGPLRGYTVGVTADRRAGEQAELLRRRGARVLLGPSMATSYLDGDDALRRATAALVAAPPDTLVLSTGIGVRAWFEAAQVWGLAGALTTALRHARVLARGAKAEAAALAAGLEVAVRAEQLQQLLPLVDARPGRRVAVQLHGDDDIPMVHALAAAGAAVQEVRVYRWGVPADTGPARRLVTAACDGALDAVTFTSAPAVRNLLAIAEEEGRGGALRRALSGPVVAACIGPVCAAAAIDAGIANPVAPASGRLGLLVREITEALISRRRWLRVPASDEPVLLQGTRVEIAGLGAVVELSRREAALLHALAARPGTVVGTETLLRRVWNEQRADPRRLQAAAGRLRRRLEPAGLDVVAVARRGYRLDAAPAPDPAPGGAALSAPRPPSAAGG